MGEESIWQLHKRLLAVSPIDAHVVIGFPRVESCPYCCRSRFPEPAGQGDTGCGPAHCRNGAVLGVHRHFLPCLDRVHGDLSTLDSGLHHEVTSERGGGHARI